LSGGESLVRLGPEAGEGGPVTRIKDWVSFAREGKEGTEGGGDWKRLRRRRAREGAERERVRGVHGCGKRARLISASTL
jgi:hypothetical protein